MYISHFGLQILPFENVPDPAFFFDHGAYARLRSRISDSVKAGRGLTVVTGPIGSGKTTVSQMITGDITSDMRLIWMAEPPEKSSDLFLFIAQELGLQPATSERVFILRDIKDALMNLHKAGGRCLLIIDESHLMSDDVINSIRILNNLEVGANKLMQILLLGQEELMDLINRPEMEPFKQRIATLAVMGMMKSDNIRPYIAHRLEIAGGSEKIFSEAGWQALEAAFGAICTPRIINSLCDRTLNAAFERDVTAADVDDVYAAAKGMGMESEVFHFKIAQRKRDNSVSGQKDAGIPSHIKEVAPDEEYPERSIQSWTTRKEAAAGVSPGMKGPILALFISSSALVLSIVFFCSRAESSDIVMCLKRLVGI
ncbi:MAG: AAA family ATPase [Nitrospira sp.]|nr:AAA family ATPase [bacterium]MBL7050137.1 AAA family ATPase [Nitrospira sp.]